MTEPIDKSHMFWGNKDVYYSDGHSIPWATYRCKHTANKKQHRCKLVTDHPGTHICICERKFGGVANV